MDTFNLFLKSSGINPNSSRAKALKAQYVSSGSPYINEVDNIQKELYNRNKELNKDMPSWAKWAINNAPWALNSNTGFFTHSMNPDEPDTIHISKGDVPVFIEESLHAEQFKDLNPAQKDSLMNVNLRELEDLGAGEQYTTPGTVESIHATEGPEYHKKYKEATTRDLGSLLGWFKNKWYDYHRTKHKLEEH